MTTSQKGDLRTGKDSRSFPFKKLLKRIVPSSVLPSVYFGKRIVNETNRIVASGPMKGLKYIDKNFWGTYYPKLLGIYEKELHPAVEKIIASKPDVLIDIGAAEGYYAIGLSLRLPESKIIGFEIAEEGQQLMEQMAQKNNTRKQLEIRGECRPDELENALKSTKSPVVICDVEGYEDVLMDPVACPSLVKSQLLVEIHEFASPGVQQRILDRFSNTHYCEVIHQTERTRADYPYPDWYFRILPTFLAVTPVHEYRNGLIKQMTWLYCIPKN